MATTSPKGTQDFESIEAFLRVRCEHFRGVGSVRSDDLTDTINGRNCIHVLATTPGISALFKKVLYGPKSRISVYLVSESRDAEDPVFNFATIVFIASRTVRRWWLVGKPSFVYP